MPNYVVGGGGNLLKIEGRGRKNTWIDKHAYNYFMLAKDWIKFCQKVYCNIQNSH